VSEFIIVTKKDHLAVHSVGYYSRERAQQVVDSGECGKYWSDKEQAACGFEVIEKPPRRKRCP
jgi:hypothetical protein